MIRTGILFITLQLSLLSCNQAQDKAEQKVLNHVGSIQTDASLDDPTFIVCDETWTYEYYNFGKGVQFEGEKIKILNHFKEQYKPLAKDNGYFTIRFVVNCRGETGRYRIESMNFDYQPIVFDEKTADQLLTLTKELKGWGIAAYEKKERDYYQYLTFKLEDGRITEILP